MPDRNAIIKTLANIKPLFTSHNVGRKQVLLANDETSSAITQIAVTALDKGEMIDTHIHNTMDEHFIFLSGEGSATVEGTDFVIQSGTYLLVPAGTIHSMCAVTDLKFITLGIALDKKS